MKKNILAVIIIFIICLIAGCGDKTGYDNESETDTYQSTESVESSDDFEYEDTNDETDISAESNENSDEIIAEDGIYDSKDDVALYIHTYDRLPSNYITKKEAKALGWSGGSLDEYAPGKCIGGDYFGNYEGNLPDEDGREYHECDIDTLHSSSRGAKRIVYSNDGLIFFTQDHYNTFEEIY